MSLGRYDIVLVSLGLYSPEVVYTLKTRIRDARFCEKREGGLKRSDSVDASGKRALKATREVTPQLFDESNVHQAWGPKIPGKGEIHEERS